MSADRERAFAEACLEAVRTLLAEGAPLRAEMEGQSGRRLRSLALEQGGGGAVVVAVTTDRDGRDATERYALPEAAEVDQVAFDVAVAIANV